MLTRIKLYLVTIAVGIGAVFSAIAMVRRSERQGIEREHVRRRLDAMREAKKVQDDVESDPYLVDRAHQWVREDDRR